MASRTTHYKRCERKHESRLGQTLCVRLTPPLFWLNKQFSLYFGSLSFQIPSTEQAKEIRKAVL
jgi:hypothetical protein